MGHGCIVRSKQVGPDAERLETHRGSAMPQTGNSVQVQTVVHNNNVQREQGICKLHSVAGLWLGGEKSCALLAWWHQVGGGLEKSIVH